MFTNNYIKYRELMFFGQSENRTFVDCDGGTTACSAQHSWYGDIGRAIRKAYCDVQVATKTHTTANTSARLNPGVRFGTGSTPANKDDYKLESPITSGLAITNPTIDTTSGVTQIPMEVSDGKYTYVVPFMVQNTTESEINIWEIGLFGEVGTSTSYRVSHVLFERTVLSEPITIAPGETKTVTYKLTLNQS